MKRILKRLGISVCSILLGFCLTAQAAASHVAKKHKPIFRSHGPYIGVMLGASETHYNTGAFDNTNNNQDAVNGVIDSSGFGQRGMLGWQFNNYIAVEGAYTRYGTTSGHRFSVGSTNNISGTIEEDSVDLVGKGIWPIAQEIDLFAKLGVAEVYSKTKTGAGFSKSRSAFGPAYGAGVNFNITRHFALDVAYQRAQGSGRIEPADLFGLGFYYHFF